MLAVKPEEVKVPEILFAISAVCMLIGYVSLRNIDQSRATTYPSNLTFLLVTIVSCGLGGMFGAVAFTLLP